MEPSSLTRRCEVCGTRFDSTVAVCPTDRRALGPDDPSVADIGSYRLIQRIGEGGMGAVYRAVHRKLGRTVAIKMLQRDLTAETGLINRFFHEARAANTVRHPHVIEVYDFVETGRDIYFVMEYLRGEDLHDAVHRRDSAPMTIERAVLILEQIASGLHATHTRDIVHRDVKPENIFLAEKSGVRDFVKIFDFGVAKLDRPDGRMTVEGAVLGTPEYMSPEQARGQPIDGRSDIYSLGCVAYEMLTRQHVFRGRTQAEVLSAQIHKQPTALRQIAPIIPAALDDAVLRALAKSPADRPPTALAFAESLARAIGRGLTDSGAFTGARRAASRTTPNTGLLLRASDNRSRAWKPLAVAAMAATMFTGAVVLGKRDPVRTVAAASTVAKADQPAAGAQPALQLATIVLESDPTGADVLDPSGQRLGVTPYRMTVPPGGDQQIRLQKAGYRPVERRFGTKADATIAVRLEPITAEPAARRRRLRLGGTGETRSALDSPAGTIDPFAE
ncbi:MAG: eukaryotic-like serine/threonine-protein kinase [Myxococcales bacterium]|jgi:serine/threonine-protein kinase|nr:eukaryotic-like serine/threonine-protein kinase [Myxococcales bacterium]